jgi:integrase
MDTESAFEQFLSQLSGQSRENLRNYRHRLRRFLDTHGRASPALITRAHVNEWHRELLSHGRAPATIAGYRQALKSFLRWCQINDHLATNPADHLKTGSFIPQRVKIPLEEDVQRVTAHAVQNLNTADPLAVRRALAWLYVLESGARLGGIHALSVAEVNRALNHYSTATTLSLISYEKTGPATHNVSTNTINALRRYLQLRPATKSRQLLVSGRFPHPPLSKQTIQKDFEAICLAVDVATIYPHALRHRVGDIITRSISAKVAQIKLGHADVKTTLQYYHNADNADLVAATIAVSPQPQTPLYEDELARLFGVYD